MTDPKKGPKRGNAGKGRPKGAVNKTTREVKEMILAALEGVGGIDYLQARAKDPKTASAFLTLVGKVLPLQVAGDPENPLTVQVVRRVIVRCNENA